MRLREPMEGLGRFLFYNPWVSLKGIAGMFSWSYERTRRILGDPMLFERARIPSRDGRGYQDLYALTGEGQKTLLGAYRSPRALASALAMSYSRLAQARGLLLDLKVAGRLVWSISPWQMGARGPYLDVLACLNRGRGLGTLAAFVFPVPDARLPWYLDFIARWQRWKNTPGSPPGIEKIVSWLIFWQPPLGPGARQLLAEEIHPTSGILCLWGKANRSTKDWKPRLPSEAWPVSLLQPDLFLPDRRDRSYPGAATTQVWAASHQGQEAIAVRFLQKSSAGEVQLLETLARFPGLTRTGYRFLDPHAKSRRAFPERLAGLCEEGLVISGAGSGEPYYFSEKGLGVLASLYGLGRKELNRYLGWPVRKRQFRQEARHQGIVLDFMLRLAREKRLVAWDFAATRHEFRRLPLPRARKSFRLVILPDSAGALVAGPGRVVLFWLEVDRGTRSGKSLAWKLEKYFLAHAAGTRSAPVPAILYLVDTGTLADEGRLRSVGRLLQSLAGIYPASPLVMLLTTRDLVWGAGKRSLVEARVWRVFRGGRLGTRLVSLANAHQEGA